MWFRAKPELIYLQNILALLEDFETRMKLMALDLSVLTAAVNKVSTDADLLIASNGTAAAQLATDQAAVNALVPAVAAVSTKIEAALAPPAPAAPAA